MTARDVRLVPIDPEVMDASTMRQPIDEPHFSWSVGYAPERDENLSARVVFGTIHGAGADGFGEVTVATMMEYPEDVELTTEEFREILTHSDALETLYDVARIAFRSVVAVSGVTVEVPRAAPEPDLNELMRKPEADDGPEDNTAPVEATES